MNCQKRIYKWVLGSRFKHLALAAHHLIVELAVFARDCIERRKAKRRHRNSKELKLNIGCGAKTKDGWVNLDFAPQADFRLDLRSKLPFPDQSCQYIFCEHFIEHLEYPSGAAFFLSECHRVLQPGGQLSLSMPETEEPLRRYRSDDEHAYFTSEQVIAWHDRWCETPLEHINYHFRQNATDRPTNHPEYHHFAYDFETIAKAIRLAGFPATAMRPFDPALDSEDRRDGSLRVVAMK